MEKLTSEDSSTDTAEAGTDENTEAYSEDGTTERNLLKIKTAMQDEDVSFGEASFLFL